MRKMISIFLCLFLTVGLISTTALGANPVGRAYSSVSISGATIQVSGSATATNGFAAGTLTLTGKATPNANFQSNGNTTYMATRYGFTDKYNYINSCSAYSSAKSRYNIGFRCGYVNANYKEDVSGRSVASTNTIKLY